MAAILSQGRWVNHIRSGLVCTEDITWIITGPAGQLVPTITSSSADTVLTVKLHNFVIISLTSGFQLYFCWSGNMIEKGHQMIEKGHQMIEKGHQMIEKGHQMIEKGRQNFAKHHGTSKADYHHRLFFVYNKFNSLTSVFISYSK